MERCTKCGNELSYMTNSTYCSDCTRRELYGQRELYGRAIVEQNSEDFLGPLHEVEIMRHRTEKQVISGFHRPVCKKCNCEMRPEKNGVGVLDMYRPSDCNEPQPYEIWDADLWKCPSCGIEVVGGFGSSAISAHHKPDFNLQINFYEKSGNLIKNIG